MTARFPLACRVPLLAAATAIWLTGCAAGAPGVAAPTGLPVGGGLFGNQGAAVGAGVQTGATTATGTSTGVTANAGATLATGAGGTRTRDAADAYVDGVLAIGLGDQAAANLTGRQTASASGSGSAKVSSGGGDPWAAEAKEKCGNGSYEDKMFYCHGVITPSVS